MKEQIDQCAQELAVNEERWRLATSGARIGVWDWKLSSDQVFYSVEWMQIRGCDEAEIEGVSSDCFDRVHPNDLDELRAGRAKLIDGVQDNLEFEHRVRHRNGSWIWILERAHVVRDEVGKAVRLVGCDLEVTDRKQRELGLQCSEQHYATIADAAPVAILQFDESSCIYANEYWGEVTGRPSRSALGAGWLEAIHPDDREKALKCRLKLNVGPANEELVRDGILGRNLNSDGSINWFLSKTRVKYSADGKLDTCTVTLTNVTERQKLLEHQERLTSILEATTDYAGISTAQFETIWQNRRLLEVRPNGDDPNGVHPEWAWSLLREVALPYAAEHGIWSGETALLEMDGNEIPVSQVVIAHKGKDGEVETFSTIMRDITDVKAAESALRQSERHFSSLASASPVGIFRVDASGNYVYVNERWSELSGWTAESALANRSEDAIHPENAIYPEDVIHPGDLAKLREHFRAFVADKSRLLADPIEGRHLMPDGSTKWIQSHACKEFDDDGIFVGYIGTLSDVTAQKVGEEKLRKVSHQLNLVLKNSSVGIWEWNPASDELFWDEGMMEIYGVQPSEFLGTGEEWRKRLYPDDLRSMQQVDYPRLFDDGHVSTNFRIARDDGETRHIYGEQFVHKDDQSKVIMVTGLNMDVTERKKTELALRESEDKFQRVAEHIPGVVYRYIVHPDGSDEFAYVSSQVREVFELDPESAIGDADYMWSHTHVEDKEWLRREILASANILEPFICEFRLELPIKGLRWVQAFARPVRSENGDVIWDGIIIDNTERKSAELALQESQERYHLITENVPGVIFQFLLRPDSSHEILYANSRVKDFFGFTAEAVVKDGQICWDRFHPDDLPGYQLAIEASAKTLEEFKEEFRLVFDDRVIWLENSSRPRKLANGDVVWDGVMIDISKRKEIELALNESQSQFKRMTENVPGMIFRCMVHPDGKHQVTYVSAQSRELFEVEPDEVIEDSNELMKFIHPDDVEEFYESRRQACETLQPVNKEFRVLLPQQGLRWRQIIGQPTRGERGVTLFDCVALDITDAKRAQLQLRVANNELETATKMKDQFLANMSHELRTPLNAILGMTEGLQNNLYGSINPKQRASLDIVEQSGMHLLELINDVLDLATIESGQIELVRSSFDVKGLCESSLQLVTPQADKKNIQLNFNVPWNLPKFFADEKRIRQVLINLLINAVKFTPDGGNVTLEVDRLSAGESQSKDTLRFSVSDSGVGIQPELVDSVFLPFVQVDSSLSRKHDGTGLGLSLVKQFVELHGGQVTVTSELGVGSCFVIELPCLHQADTDGVLEQWDSQSNLDSLGDSQDKSKSVDDAGAKASLPTILLAEDNDSVAAAVKWYLEARGYEVQRAHDGQIAIELAKKFEPDLILMDIQMPNVDGLSAIKQIRETHKISDVPIVALTGLAMGEDAECCIAAGANAYLSKPSPMEDLIRVIERLAGQHASNC